MLHRSCSVRAILSPLVLLLVGGVAVVATTPRICRAQPAATPEAPAGGLEVPPLPEGTPEELMKFALGLRKPARQPKSREEALAYMQGVAATSVQAAEKILAQVKPDDRLHDEAARLKLESLMMLSQTGDAQAATDMATYAKTLVDSPSPALALEAKRLLLVSDARELLSTRTLDGAPDLIKRTADLLAADPNDADTAMLATQLAGVFEQMPDAGEHAANAYRAFGPIFATSTNAQIKQMGESFAGTLRRLSLPGSPMEIEGTLLDGTAFDQKSLAGKVVLVDFWATWCGPCVAEIPNMIDQYEKYHDKGFEIVGISLDEDRAAVEGFVKEAKIPWPILFAGKGWGDPVASFYGITGIPQLILIGRDGNVITLNARGEALAKELATLFKDAG